jgi:hypothetical protein
VGSGQAVVRMYRQGLGDCFLVFLHRPGGKPFKLMVDCGVIAGTLQPEARMREVVADIAETTEGFVDVLVVTHEHWDHVSGLTQAADLFADEPAPGKLAVGEVWLAWTEDTNDPEAAALQQGLQHLLRKVRRSGTSLARFAAEVGASTDSTLQQVLEGQRSILAFFGYEEDEAFLPESGLGAASEGGGRTREAMLQAAKLGKVRYLTPGEKPWMHAEVPGVRIFTLGPPKDPLALRRTDPGAEGYHVAFEESDPFSAALTAAEDGSDLGAPFENGLVLPTGGATLPNDEAWNFLQRHYLASHAEEEVRLPYEDGLLRPRWADSQTLPGTRSGGSVAVEQGWRRIDADWTHEAAQFALQLDAATNNTSLVLAIELSDGGPVLLLVGDAQAGNWLSWDKLRWRLDGRRVSAADLLARTCFYKVGHHGSHNATLKDLGLERMTRNDLVAFVPVDRTTARKKRWNRMPLPSIVEKLDKITGERTVLSEVEPPKGEERHSHAGFGSEFQENELYVQVRVPLRS